MILKIPNRINKKNLKRLLPFLIIAIPLLTLFTFHSVDKTRKYIENFEVSNAISSFGYLFISSEEKNALKDSKSIYSSLDKAKETTLTSEYDLANNLSLNHYLYAIRYCIATSENSSSKLFDSLWRNARKEIINDLTDAGLELNGVTATLIFEDTYNNKDNSLDADYYPYSLAHDVDDIKDKISDFFPGGYYY